MRSLSLKRGVAGGTVVGVVAVALYVVNTPNPSVGVIVGMIVAIVIAVAAVALLAAYGMRERR
jgi:hypothetical protein